MRGTRRAAALLLSVAAVVGAPARGARAWHDEDVRLLDRTAYTLAQGEVRVGLWQAEVGLVDALAVGTMTLPYLAAVVSDYVGPNLYLESPLLRRGPHFASLRLGAVYAMRLDDPSIGAWLVPVTAAYSHRFDRRVSLHGRVTFTGLAASAAAEAEDQSFEGNAFANLVLADGTVEVRLARSIAVVGTVQWAPWVSDLVASARVDLGASLGGDGELEVDNEPLRQAWSVLLALALSFRFVDLRIGFGYGNLFLLDLGLVLAERDFFPELALDFRF